MHRTSAFITVLLSYIGLFLIFLSWTHFYDVSGPTAKNGVIDLSHWNFEKNGNVRLNGTWQFYPNQLLTPKTLHDEQARHSMMVPVPDNSRNSIAKNSAEAQAGTYRLIIRSERGGQIFGLRTIVIYSSNRVFMNGQLIGQSGKPSLGSPQQASLRPYVTYFPLRKGDNELMIQTSRAIGSSGQGITKPIILGTQEKMARSHDFALFNDMLMIVAFFFMSLYFFGYYFQRRKDVHLLFFSIFCLFFAVVISWISQARIIYLLIPNLSLSMLAAIEGISTIGIGISVLLYLYYAYPRLVSRKILLLGIALSLLTLFLDTLPFDFLSYVTYYLHTFLAVSILAYASYIFVLAIIQHMEGSVYLTIGTFSMSTFVIITTINSYSSKNFFSVYSVFSLIFLLMLSLMMSKRFSNAFERSETLAEELIQNDKLKDEFIAKTSHEFRTPLNGIINTAQTLLAGKRDRKIGEEADKIQMITRIGYRLSALVNDILDMEKIKQGNLALNLIPLEVSTTAKTELAFYKLLAEKKGLTIINEIPADLPLIYADENRFRQILNNLVENAVNYTRHGQITLSACQKGRTVEITVSDTGIGIPSSERNKIFQSFVRSDELNQSEGAGLGLSIVKQLVELQKGTIWFDSEVGTGTAFHFTVPIFEQTQTIQPGATVRLPNAHWNSDSTDDPAVPPLVTPYRSHLVDAPTILIVDDNLENLKILIDMLENIPYNVVAVKNGIEALTSVSQARPDLVILDLMMPGMSGFDVCRKIREQYSLIELPVLMLTAAIINDDKHYAFRAGANDILQKPYNFSEFSARVRGLILMKQVANQATNMEIAFLQSQIRPHFLYNVLNSIIALSYEDIEKSREMTAQFAAYLRGSFDFQNTSAMSTFKKELALVKSYLKIEKMRFQDRIQISMDIDETLNFPLPPLMIQPLVENAVQHGIGKRKAGGRIILSVTRHDHAYEISVKDDGVGMNEEEIKNILSRNHGRSVGLKNINERLRHYFGSQLMIQSDVGRGTSVSYKIKVDQSSEDSND
ncbi:ATP-binding protein [Sporolactobacillus shoreicorticis]|uniref:histidine kinase n=1 Tax=Sporolactobacillus shoreicorticis TaxID=1923877 RepID=A0ABW5SAM7_9BACL|nr:ATP-binding protein [Sporolactobacillus shoreicorticis]MCO7125477.1 ATP-binding protein [Sporolactobacillus shoreicorticis]